MRLPTPKPDLSDVVPPAWLCFLEVSQPPKEHHYLENVQMYDLEGDTSHSVHYIYEPQTVPQAGDQGTIPELVGTFLI